MKSYLLSLFSVLILAGSFNFYIDPAHHFWRFPKKIEKNWGDDQLLLLPENFDMRVLKRQHLDTIAQQPDLVVLGSSRGFFIDKRMFSEGLKIFNASVSNGTLEDYVWIWQALKQRGNIPKWVVFSVDPWVICSNAVRGAWRVNSDLYRQFLKEHQSEIPTSSELQRQLLLNRFETAFENTAELLSWKMLSASYFEFRSRSFSDDFTTLISEGGSTGKRAWFRNDGSYSYPAHEMVPKDKANLDNVLASELVESNFHYRELVEWSVSNEYVQLFKVLLEDMNKFGVKLVFLIQPYAPGVYAQKNIAATFRGLESKFAPKVRDIARTVPGTLVCDYLPPDSHQCASDEFMEFMHPLKPCVNRVLVDCLKRDSALASKLKPVQTRWF